MTGELTAVERAALRREKEQSGGQADAFVLRVSALKTIHSRHRYTKRDLFRMIQAVEELMQSLEQIPEDEGS